MPIDMYLGIVEWKIYKNYLYTQIHIMEEIHYPYTMYCDGK